MANLTKIRRIGAGQYSASRKIGKGDYYTVAITYFDHLRAWIAAANWDRHLHTDPTPTKRDAVREARAMIEDQIKERVQAAIETQRKIRELIAQA